jgi:SpoVK/Ycf46/Vps4 family AAA+-type ATPase
MEKIIIDYLTSIKNELQQNCKQKKTIKVKSILRQIGYQRRSQILIDKFNSCLFELELKINPSFTIYLSYDETVTIFLDKVSGIEIEPVNSVETNTTGSSFEVLQVKHDFFYYLFDFGSEQEYERFQACLDSNKPVGIFLVPAKDDFFAEIVTKILTYEAIRKKQYIGAATSLVTSSAELGNVIQSNENPEASIGKYQEQLSYSTILHFSQSSMTNVILGNTSFELIDSERFDEKFEQLSLYANKYYSDQFFIVFHCPSETEVYSHQKQDIFSHLVDGVTRKLPFVFTLKCKYPDDKSIPTDVKKNIHEHFRLLLEAPQHILDEDDLPLVDYFIELQKLQNQFESQLLLKMQPKHFRSLIYGFESDEHIYLKYFAVKTLEQQGYQLCQIRCEATVNPNTNDGNNEQSAIKRRPDVYIENKIIVEIETLRSKTFGDNVFLDLIQSILVKIAGWPSRLNKIWLVFPGFEIARNYYQLKKTKEILLEELIEKYGKTVELSIMTPDYENHQLIPVSFDLINYPSFKSKAKIIQPIINTANKSKQVIYDFKYVKGLNEEKSKLSKLLKIQAKGLRSGINGILFFGLPGCGKTLLANSFANESGRYFLKFAPADIQSMYIGQSQKNLKDIFSQAKKKYPSILFIDELDSIGFSRSELHAHTDQKATINQLLIELNNIGNSNVIVIAATNYLTGIDNALKRSGRLDWKIPIFPPDAAERAELFKHYLLETSINENILIATEFTKLLDYEAIGRHSIRLTPSDIELVCKEIKNDILLDEISAEITTSNVIDYIDNNNRKGGLSLTESQVSQFVNECKSLSIKSLKLQILRKEWDIE